MTLAKVPSWARSVLELNPAPTLVLELRGDPATGPLRFVSANAALESWLARPLEGGPGRPIEAVVPELAPCVAAAVRGTASSSGVHVTSEAHPRREPARPITIRAQRRGPHLVVSFVEDASCVAALRSEIARRDALLRELHHRVKNHLQIVSSFAAIHFAQSTDARSRTHAQALERRIRAIALVHEQLQRASAVDVVDLGEHLGAVARATRCIHDAAAVELTVETTPVRVRADVAIDCGLLVTELVGNSFKHAFRGDTPGRVRVRLTRESGESRIEVEDDGSGFPDVFPPRAAGTLGLAIVEQLAQRLGGEVIWRRRRGAHVEIRFPDRALEEVPG